MTGENEVTPRTETVLMLLAGFAAIVAFKRFTLLRFAAPWLVRGVINRALTPPATFQHAPVHH